MRSTIDVRAYVTAEIWRTAEYKAGRKLSQQEVARAVEWEMRDVVARWEKLGHWLNSVDESERVDKHTKPVVY